jgi:hypothetical protein
VPFSPVIHDIALFGLHTALRESWTSGLKWEWERRIPQAGPDVFLFELPDSKGGLPMYAFCNSVAREIINRFGPTRSKMPRHLRVHDLRVTCSTWLREAGGLPGGPAGGFESLQRRHHHA